MATITTSTPFANATALVAGTWNSKYDLLYNELNGNIENVNIKSAAAIVESKIAFSSSGHDHTASEPILVTSITTSGSTKGDIIYFNGTEWARISSGAEGTQLKVGYDTETKLLSHFDGADGATSYTAETAQTITFVGNAQLDTAQKKFGTASLLCDGTGDYVTLPDNADWSFGTGNFTIDFQIRFNSVSGTTRFMGQRVDNDNRWFLELDSNLLTMFFRSSASTKAQYSCSWTPSINTWYHLAFVRNGTSALIFIDGVSQGLTETVSFGTNDVGNIASVLYIGHDGSIYYVNGWMDEIRISKGIARYTSNFTPPTMQYQSSLFWK